MKTLSRFVAFAVLLFLLAVIQHGSSLPSDADGKASIVKRGLLDCPHDCWGDINVEITTERLARGMGRVTVANNHTMV
ncbi:hypothetical protein Bhyg_04700 [Pseudolycoriella hygida]|uniref:Uncharacterized protein n=1 Tax=Pseudolycoriella hygida TaxID=35572 RepID=A0A9Q0S8K5_9DIPT|nr:hypothetical protein Bhyg_04700 [Pseudolycoriella hygida]